MNWQVIGMVIAIAIGIGIGIAAGYSLVDGWPFNGNILVYGKTI